MYSNCFIAPKVHVTYNTIIQLTIETVNKIPKMIQYSYLTMRHCVLLYSKFINQNITNNTYI